MIVLFTEDRHREPLKAILQHIGLRVRILSARGAGRLLNETWMRNQVQTALMQFSGTDRVIALIDGDCKVEEVRRQAREVEAALRRSRLRSVPRYFVVEHEIESWLCALPVDLGRGGRRPSQSDLHRAKKYLKSLFDKRHRTYVPTRDNLDLASHLDVLALAEAYPNFAAFIAFLRSPDPEA